MAPSDPHYGEYGSFAAPATRAAAVVTSDTQDLGVVCRAVYVGGTGNVTLTTAGGDTIAFNGVPAGTILPIATTRVKATGTTATNLVVLW